ncbi:MAG: sugar ABC transporter permease [Lachnospiraceae bacterium]|jgi:multiple sugar transport system permease protein|nr:sugar ABC transporter permease [Lachnospiraceae bacterium]MEE3461920.1 sugar ABC transporter permease [Lachnospiraceae bacterium]
MEFFKALNKKKKGRACFRRRLLEEKNSILFLLPSLLGVLVFFIIPFFVIIYYSMIDNPIQANFVGIENFKKIITNSAFIQASKNTLTFTLVSVPLIVVLSLLLAMLLESSIPGKSAFRTFFLSPMMVPIASIVLIWRVLFDYHGAVNQIMTVINAQPVDWFKSAFGQLVIVILFLWKNLGYDMILFMAALSSIPRDVIEVATLESASKSQIFFRIKLRYLAPTILFVTILSIINSFKVFREVFLLTGDYPYDTLYMLQHFMNNTFHALDYQKLSAAAIIMFIVVTIIIGILFIIEEKYDKDVEG